MFDFAPATAFFEAVTGYPLKDERLVREVFDASGLGKVQSNQGLALLGDRAISLVLVDDWYSTNAPKGHADRILQQVAGNANLQKHAAAARIDQHIMVNPGHTGPVGGKVLVTTLEAMLGAIWRHSEGNINAVRTAMTKLGLVPERQ